MSRRRALMSEPDRKLREAAAAPFKADPLGDLQGGRRVVRQLENEAVVELDGLLNLPSDDSKELRLPPPLSRVERLCRAGDRGIRLRGGSRVEHGYGHENRRKHEC